MRNASIVAIGSKKGQDDPLPSSFMPIRIADAISTLSEQAVLLFEKDQQCKHWVETDGVREGIQQKLKEVLCIRHSLEHLSSLSAQIEHYPEGAEAWETDYVLLSHLQDPAAQKELWNNLPDCLFKRAQEALSTQERYCIPQQLLSTGRYTKEDADRLDLQGILLDPDRIPDDLAEQAGAVFTTVHERNPIARRLVVVQPHIIRNLKSILASAHRLTPGNNRLWVVGTPSRESAGSEYSFNPELSGSVLYFRTPPQKKEEQEAVPGKTQQMQLFPSARNAFFKTGHQEHSYTHEASILIGIQSRMSALVKRFNTKYTKEADKNVKDRLAQEASAAIKEEAETLELCEHVEKVHAHSLLQLSKELTDSIGRRNVTVSMTRWVHVQRALERRLKDIERKTRYRTDDMSHLQIELMKEDHVLRTFRNAVWNNGKDGRFAALSALDAGSLTQVKLKPNRLYAEQLHELHGYMSQRLEAEDQEGARSATVAMHVVGKMLAARNCIDTIHKQAVTLNIRHEEPALVARTLSVSATHWLEKLDSFVGTYQIEPDRIIQPLVPAFENLLEVIEQIKKVVEQMSTIGTNNAEVAKEMLSSFRQQLKDADIEKILLSIDLHDLMAEEEEVEASAAPTANV